MREVPYHTTDDESQYCGHIWRHSHYLTGPWGYCWRVLEPYGSEIAGGWRSTQESAEQAMNEVLARYKR